MSFIFDPEVKLGKYKDLGVKKDKVKEIILALKPSVEGETTSLYISKILEGTGVKISKIAHGVPMGAEIDYVDSLTLEMALENRRYMD